MSHLTRLIRLVRHWHARFGVVAALFFLILAVTGVALNHTEALSLDKIQVRSPALMTWYGLRADPPREGYRLASGYFVGNHDHWVMDDRLLAENGGEVVGVAETNDLRYVATGHSLFIYQSGGELLEKLDGPGLPVSEIVRLGVAGNLLVLASPQASVATADGLNWQPHAGDGVAWAVSVPLPAELADRIGQHFRPELPLERIVLDLHSGRLFGAWGPWVMDVAAVLLLSLSLSGLWIYIRTVRRKH